MENRLIFLIENQIFQFIEIKKNLNNNGFIVYPDIPNNDTIIENIKEYKRFIDLIRILLNTRYGGIEDGAKRKKALDKIIEIIHDKKPSLFIIDHILVGCHDAETGIDLAIKLRENNITNPIIFLSRTDENDVKIKKDFPKVDEPKSWIHKGYSGNRVNEPTYFNEHVIPEIEKLLKSSYDDIVRNKIISILKNLNTGSSELDTDLHNKLVSLSNDISQIPESVSNILIEINDLPTEEERKKLFSAIGG